MFLDLAVLDYISAEGLETEICTRYKNSLKNIELNRRLTFLADQKGFKGTDLATRINRLTDVKSEFSLDVLNGYVHGKDTSYLDRNFLNRLWDNLFPLFQQLLDITEDSNI